jgi:outer membrane protein TolC
VEVAQAVLALRNADELYQSQKKNIDLAREALRMVESGHRIGRNTQIEVLDARSALTEAVGGYHQALHNLATARLRLQLAIGTLSAETLVASENGVEVR